MLIKCNTEAEMILQIAEAQIGQTERLIFHFFEILKNITKRWVPALK